VINIFLLLLVGSKKSKKKPKAVPLNDFLGAKKSPAYAPAPNWADATEDIDPSGTSDSQMLQVMCRNSQ